MKSIAKFLALGVFAASTTLAAHATPLSPGAISISGGTGAITTTPSCSGNPCVSSSTTQITFAANDEFAFGNSSDGSLSNVGPELSSFVMASTFTVNTGTAPTPPLLFGFAYSYGGGNTLLFVVNDVVSETNAYPGSLQFQGYVQEATCTVGPSCTPIANTATAADFNLTPDTANNGTVGGFTGSLVVAPTPEPSSLLLLGTGLASAAGVVFRKRRSVTA